MAVQLPNPGDGSTGPNVSLPVSGTRPPKPPGHDDTGRAEPVYSLPGPEAQLPQTTAAPTAAVPTYDGPTFSGGQSNPGSNNPGSWGSSSPIGLMDSVGRFNEEGLRDAASREVGDNELVENRLTGLLGSDSRYIRDARLRGRSEASARGMLTGSIGQGMAERSAIAAGMPIASQDAATYGRVADANLGYENQMRLAQQGIIGSLIGQETGIRANLDDSERNRGFQATENELLRAFQGSESALNRALQMSEAERDRFLTREQNDLMRQFQSQEAGLDREFTAGENLANRDWQAGQAEIERDFAAIQADIARNWQGTQADLDRIQQRNLTYFNQIYGQSGMLAQTLISIYENPNLTPQQQQAAIQNANAMFHAIFQSTAQTFAQGIPEIFQNPYPMDPNAPPLPPPEFSQTPMPGNGGANDPELNAGLTPNQLAQIARWTAQAEQAGRPLKPNQLAQIARWRAQVAERGGG